MIGFKVEKSISSFKGVTVCYVKGERFSFPLFSVRNIRIRKMSKRILTEC